MGIGIKHGGNTQPRRPRRKVSKPFGMKNHPFDPMSGKHLPLDPRAGADMVQMNLKDKADFLENKMAGSVVVNVDDKFALDGDKEAPGADMVYGTNSAGERGWYPIAELAEDLGIPVLPADPDTLIDGDVLMRSLDGWIIRHTIEQQLVTDERYVDSPTYQLQIKTIVAMIIPKLDSEGFPVEESGWTMIEDGQFVPET